MKKRIIKIFKILILLLLIALIALLSLLYFTRVNYLQKTNIINSQQDLTNESKEIAEIKNLEQVSRQPNNDIQIGYIEVSSQSSNSGLNFVPSFELQADNSFDQIKLDPRSIPILMVDYSTLSVDALLTGNIVTNIKDLVSKNSLDSIAFSVEWTKYKEIPLILSGLQDIRDENFQIYLFVFPRPGKEINYKSFYQMDSVLQSQLTPKQIDELVDFQIIQSFSFTNEYSILPYKISDLGLTERTIQYYLSQSVPASKIYLQITNFSYIWDEREIPKNYSENYTWLEIQAQITKEVPAGSQLLKTIDGNQFLGFTTSEGISKIRVSQTQEHKDSLKNLAIEYGLVGVIYD